MIDPDIWYVIGRDGNLDQSHTKYLDGSFCLIHLPRCVELFRHTHTFIDLWRLEGGGCHSCECHTPPSGC